MTTAGRRSSTLAGLLLAWALAGAITAAMAGAVSGLGLDALLDGFVVSSTTIGLALAVAGWPIARHRPQNAVGWLLLAAGIAYVTSAAGFALLVGAAPDDTTDPAWRVVATITNLAWPWAIGLLLPVALCAFPDGRLITRRWRWVVAAGVVSALALCATAVLPADTLSGDAGVRGYPTAARPPAAWVGATAMVVGTVVYGATLVSLCVRYRRGNEQVRRQLLWLLLAAVVMVVSFVVGDYSGADSWLSIFSIALVPAAIAVAILRYQLLDIRLVVSRSVLYVVLTAAAVGVYAGAVAVLGALLQPRGTSVVATLVVAALFNPARVWLQRRLDRVFYGSRSDPGRALAEVAQRFGDVGATGLDAVLTALIDVLRLPSAAIVVDGRELAGCGTPRSGRSSIPLRQGDELVAELVVGLRPGQSRLDAADERILVPLAASISVAVHSMLLSEQLRQARKAVMTGRTEERRRLRRDLHDGLGPTLTGVVLQADAARRVALTDPVRAAEAMGHVRDQTIAAMDDVRRLVNELRPPVLDGLGLVGALREHASSFSHRVDGSPLVVTVVADDALPEIPAAIEVAAYRIATEALTNVTRHSDATGATIHISADTASMRVLISDNGSRSDRAWRPGTGLVSMRERAAELGGTCDAGPASHGGRVAVTLPLGSAP